MATYPIVRSQRTMPGRSGGVRANINFDTGEAEVWRQIGNLAATGFDVAEKRYVQQAEIQLQDAILQAEAENLELVNRLRTNQDEETYQKELDKSIATMNTFRPKNGLAGRGYDSWIKSQTPGWRSDVEKSKQIRLDNKWEDLKDKLGDEAIDNPGSMAKLRVHLATGVALGRTTPEAADNYLKDIEYKSIRRAAENEALVSPELFLKKIQGNSIKGYPGIIPGDIQDLRSTAEGQINSRKRQENRAMSAFYTDVSKKAEEGMPIGQLRDLIRNQPGLTVDERENAMRVANSAYNTWDEGGTKQDPWKTTQDQGALLDMQMRISQGIPTTEMDIIKAQYAQPDKGPLFSNADRNYLFSQLPDNKDPIMKTPFADEWMNHIDEIYLDEEKKIPQDKIAEWSQTRQGVEAIIRENYPNVGKAQKEIEAFLKPTKESKSKGLLNKLWTYGSPLGITGKVTKTGKLAFTPGAMAVQAGREALKFFEGHPLHIETLEEAEKLEQGQKFEYQGKIYTRK